MKAEVVASFGTALLCHWLLLFVFRLGTPARPLALSDDPAPVEVNLVTAPPETPALEPPPPEPAATPEATPAPIPEATPPPNHDAIATPETPPEKPKPRAAPVRHVAAPSIAHSSTATDNASTRGPATSAKPRYRSNPTPDYPAEARRQRQEGVVTISVEVSSEGSAVSVSLRRSSGVPALDQAALAAVRRWTFEPARAGGIAVASRVDVPVRFSLSGH